jgi:micrococcal nuclease
VVVTLSAVASLLSAQLSFADATREVVRVVDGDTIELDGGEKVRLIGVDTPETVHPNKPVERFGKEASSFTRRTVEGKRVRLEYDPGPSRLDKYGRTLAYVYLLDGRLLNLEIIRQGYGHAYTKYPFTQSRMNEFRAAEQEARAARRGLWAPDEESRDMAPDPRLTPRRYATDSSVGSCSPREDCCKVCQRGQACGATCISASYTCHVGRGCACSGAEICR